jgi:predicted flap endonuclease-1-like 5' DNA nuclease
VAPSDTPNVPTAGSDDLTRVKGIGPVYRARLEQAGITTFAGLASSTAQKIAEAAEVTVERAADWLGQAAALAG